MSSRRASGARTRQRADVVLVVTSVARASQAHRMARALVEQRLAACVHVWPIRSVYRWRERLHAEPEYRLVCKSSAARRAALVARIRALHPYELPAIYALSPSHVDAPYARWIEESCC